MTGPRVPTTGAVLGGLVVLGALVLGGCGGDGGEDLGDVSTSSTMDVVATEMRYTPDRVAVPAGRVVITVRNEGVILHDLHVEQQPFLIEVDVGETASGQLNLEPGQYAFFCGIPGHRDAGMEGILEVRG